MLQVTVRYFLCLFTEKKTGTPVTQKQSTTRSVDLGVMFSSLPPNALQSSKNNVTGTLQCTRYARLHPALPVFQR